MIFEGKPVAVPKAAMTSAGDSAMPLGWRRDVDEVLYIGDRAAVRGIAHQLSPSGEQVSSSVCVVFEHDGERILRAWEYYEDLERMFSGTYELLDAGVAE